MSSHDTIKNDYPTNFGYTPSLYNEQDVIEEESSNFEVLLLVNSSWIVPIIAPDLVKSFEVYHPPSGLRKLIVTVIVDNWSRY